MMLLLRRILVPTLSLLALLGTAWLAPKLRRLPGGSLLNRSLEKARSRELNLRDLDALTAGYYEDLLDEGSHLVSSGSLFSCIVQPGENVAATVNVNMDSRGRQPAPFLFYEYKPNLKKHISGLQDELITNSFGMPDREYALEKPPATRRIAVLGDSIFAGWGVPFGRNFESLLENRLNEQYRDENVRQFEVLNFSVDGYRITQTLGVALDKAPQFHPDVYLVGLSDITVLRRWGYHLRLLVESKADLKYDYLRQLAKRAELRPEDNDVLPAKLAPFRLPTIRWALSEMKSNAERHGAKMILILVSSVSDAQLVRSGFNGIPEIARELGLPLLDLTDTFENVPDLNTFRVGTKDRHPNEQGHRMLFENLHAKILADREISLTILGHSPSPQQVKPVR
jgi:lysophospholipase L1-like esterase